MDNHPQLYRSAKPPSPPHRIAPGPSHFAAQPQYLKNCLYTYIYIWTADGGAYWMYPTNYNQAMLFGYIWTGLGWEYVQLRWRQIQYFY